MWLFVVAVVRYMFTTRRQRLLALPACRSWRGKALCRRRGSLYVHDSSAATAGIANLPLIAWQGSGIRSLFQLARHSLVVGFDSSVLSLSTCMHMLIWLLTVLA